MPIAIIIGAGRGIGFALTEELLLRKIDVIAISKNTDPLNKLKINYSSNLTTIFCDITDVQQRQSIFSIIKDKKTAVINLY